ncbi:MAG: hypothetical protein QOH41_725 [Blastocatellia bacterium]|nr:hypothetical protein [Blastocatellia bacterium]
MKGSVNRSEYSSAFARLFGEGEQADTAYMSLWRDLVKYFQMKGEITEAEDLAHSVIERMFKKACYDGLELPISQVSFYSFGIAKNVWQEHRRKLHLLSKQQVSLETGHPRFVLVGPEQERDEREDLLFDILDECMAKLSDRDKDLILSYYDREKRNALAADYSVSRETLRVRVHRIRQQLEARITERLNEEVRRADS